MGDINKDRYEDLAVGAPYEGRGVVYIFLGSKQGIITEPSQVRKSFSPFSEAQFNQVHLS